MLQTRRRSRNTAQRLNLMVAGFRGLGKTSFLRTLVETFDYVRPDVEVVANEMLEPTLDTYSIEADIKNGRDKIHVTLVDTAGLDEAKPLEPQCQNLMRILESGYEARLEEESKVYRDPKAVDSLIHACIYFIDPTSIPRTKGQGRGLHARDVKMLQSLGTRVNVIPVLAKCDCLTTAQRTQLRSTIVADFLYHKINIYRFGGIELRDTARKSSMSSLTSSTCFTSDTTLNETFDASDDKEEADVRSALMDLDVRDTDAWERSEELMDSIPFALVSKEEADVFDDQGRRIRGRRYPWGFIDVMNEAHCDFVKLRNALIQTQRRELKDLTHEFFYEEFRTAKLTAKYSALTGTSSAPRGPRSSIFIKKLTA